MNMHDTWEDVNMKQEVNGKDLDSVISGIARSADDDRILRAILRNMYDTEDVNYILQQVAMALEVSIEEMRYTTDDGYDVTVKRSVE